jgi:hypothetical protein
MDFGRYGIPSVILRQTVSAFAAVAPWAKMSRWRTGYAPQGISFAMRDGGTKLPERPCGRSDDNYHPPGQ